MENSKSKRSFVGLKNNQTLVRPHASEKEGGLFWVSVFTFRMTLEVNGFAQVCTILVTLGAWAQLLFALLILLDG